MSSESIREKFYEEGGREILKCIQCGTCSGSCPLAASMDHGPRALFALIRTGEMEAALASDTIWSCVSCHACSARCPRAIPVTDLIYSLKRLALNQGLAPRGHKMPDLYRAFAAEVEAGGRVSESMAMARYCLRHPGDILPALPLGLALLGRGRLEILPRRGSKAAGRLLARLAAESEERP